MSAAKSEIAAVACPNCGATLAVGLSMVGKRARCAACKEAFVIPAPAATRPGGAQSTSPPTDAAGGVPDYVGFDCRLCSARLFAETKDVGKQLRCAECGTQNAVPPPPKPKPKNIPAAMEGEQYELWEPEEQPLPSELRAAQPKFVEVICTKCDTIMYPTEKQVGQQIRCPDCGTIHVVPPPKKSLKKKSVLASDATTPLLDPTAHPGERPRVVTSKAQMLHEQEQAAEYERAVEKSKRTGKPMEIDARGRPVMPRWPLVNGVLPFLVSPGIAIAIIGLSVGYYFSLSVFLKGLEICMIGGFAAVAGMCFFTLGCVMTTVCSACAFAVLLQIIMESSEGNRRINHWPSFQDWFGSFLYLVTALMTSAIPGYVIGLVPPLNQDPYVSAAINGASAFIFLPIIILSQLEINSPWGILSHRILGSLGRYPLTWALFYFEWAILVAICGAATYFLADDDVNTALWLLPLYVSAAVLFARLLGRLAWRISEVTASEVA